MIIAAGSNFGTILYDATGQPIYLFDAEETSRPECYDECAQAWPPVLTTGEPSAKGLVQSDLLGTTRRRDGRRQVTYKGQALYFYVDDPAGQVLCNDVFEFGGTWYAVNSKGDPPA